MNAYMGVQVFLKLFDGREGCCYLIISLYEKFPLITYQSAYSPKSNMKNIEYYLWAFNFKIKHIKGFVGFFFVVFVCFIISIIIEIGSHSVTHAGVQW